MDLSWHMERSIPVPETGCWIWLGAEKGNGYGNVRHGKANLTAHRAAYIRAHGEIPAGMDVCHRCDTRLCINPSHLFAGSRMDNMRDAKAKGRLSAGSQHAHLICGEKSGAARLTAEQVEAIRRVGASLPKKDIAALTGVSVDNIRRIIRRDTWKEIEQCAA